MKVLKQKDVNINELADALKQGKVIVYPTETCYGLGCDATNQQAVDKLFEIKKRRKDKTVLALVSGLEMAGKYIELSPLVLELAKKYWPGPLTIVAPSSDKEKLATGVIGSDNFIAVRMTDNQFAGRLCAELGRPLVSTSANISDRESPYDVESVLEMYKDVGDKPDIVIDAGALPSRKPSTIIKVRDGSFEILRQGEVTVENCG